MGKVKSNFDFDKIIKEDWINVLPNDLNQYVKTTLEGINIEPLYDQSSQPLLNTISISKTIDIQEYEISNDPISNIVKKLFNCAEDNAGGVHFFEELNQLQSVNHSTFSSAAFHEIGANHIQEISYLLATISELLHQVKNNNGDIRQLLHTVQFELCVDTDFYMSIAKIKAFQLLIPIVLKEFIENIDYQKIIYITKTSKRTLTNEEETLNLIRKTIETITAFLSGVDFVRIVPYEENEEAIRWTNNIYNLLKFESGLSNYRTLLNGSYYLEELTKQVAEKAWNQFLEIEEKGGFVNFVDSGEFFKDINRTNKNRLKQFMLGDKKIVGNNAFRRVEPSTKYSQDDKTYIFRDSEWIEKCHLLLSTSWDCIILDGANEEDQKINEDIFKTLSSIGLKNQTNADVIFLAGSQESMKQFINQNKDKTVIQIGINDGSEIPYSLLHITDLPDVIEKIHCEKGWN
ncbi:hypothetical protein J5Y03_04160 [Bacillus sp. RG28]|uniref:Methylmalonyl-CoA mutase alpha/beta chain catalytic domain-containing protein n=1 Tax=Gottfriedia endophytica TaxID=2820819 RepID=A0A940NLH8_9BACI|nr:methylmalonyl-CoA mutase family protein [Gottfriedia endophytica]MBP0724379.1 hypothetical protein [Gottfriedia endophytica]